MLSEPWDGQSHCAEVIAMPEKHPALDLLTQAPFWRDIRGSILQIKARAERRYCARNHGAFPVC